jgi:hypothetical protein
LYFAIAKRSITALNNTYYLIPSELAGDTRELEMATIQHNELRTRNASFHMFARAKLSPSPQLAVSRERLNGQETYPLSILPD